MANTLLTFLGTGNYKDCIYLMADGQSSEVVQYIQEAFAQTICKDWSPNDRICVFLTEEAEKKNWIGSGRLGEKLNGSGIQAQVVPVRGLKDGFTEKDIWFNFQQILDVIGEGDHVWLDITHAFRSIPTFAVVLLDYARFLKGTHVQGIYYGAFESLGTAFDIETRIPDPNDRIAPVLDLTNVLELQDWTRAASDFIQHGSGKLLAEKASAHQLNGLAVAIENVTTAFSLVRGKEIVKGKVFVELQKQLQSKVALPPLGPILKQVGVAVGQFGQENVVNGIKAARWCYDHQLYQQGITVLRETLISLACQDLGLNPLDYKKSRKPVEQAFIAAGIPEEDWILSSGRRLQVKKYIQSATIQSFKISYRELNSEYRNDINHGGFITKPKTSKELREGLNTHLQQIIKELGL